ncbi:hypothetical protein [Microbulbifer pacificus]|uniref:Lipoprotein n=1 Tax=Microbulbifer pacificus TaxID=407164 RepID=A0AAU0MXV5_9GAMM|nr:hypothetical protein [Microbulbifer pacificus]WOX05510.1 hypothetical protein R5R33_17495 [Microbulbifer pacificus]
MRQVPHRLLAALTITLTLGGCVTYPAAPPVIGGGTYVRKATPVYSYTVITDPGYRYYDASLGVYVFYDRSDVFFRQGHYYRWYQDHWISASHWHGPWYPAPNFYVSANFNDHWHTRLRRHGQHYAGGHDYTPPRRHDRDDGYNRRDRHEGNGQRHDRREEGRDRPGQGQDRGRGGEQGFAGIAEPKPRAPQVDNRGGDRRNERQNPRPNPGRDVRAVKLADKPTGIRDPRVVPALERPATDRRTVHDRRKPQSQRGQPQPQRNAPNDQRNAAAKPASSQEGKEPKSEQPKKKTQKKKSQKTTDKRDQVNRVREPLTHRSNEPRRQID